MNSDTPDLLERAYRLAVRLHPQPFRRRFADEMIDFMRTRRREAAGRGTAASLAFWTRALIDVARSLGRERARELGAVRRVFSGAPGNMRDAVRFLRRSPGVSLTIVLLLALTIGAASSVFSVVNAVLLRPLPFHEPDRLALVWEARPQRNIERNVVGGHEFPVWNEQNRTFERMAAIAYSGTVTLTGAGEPKALTGVKVTSAFFDVMGVRPLIGRGFLPSEDEPGQGQVLVMSEQLWRERFGGDPQVIGRTVVLDERPFEVVGVMDRTFTFPPMVLGAQVDYWAPIAEPIRNYRGRHYLTVVGRLKPGVTIDAAREDMSRVAADLTREFPQLNHGHETRVVPLQGDLVRDSRASLMLLFGSVCCLLLIGCTNVASLLLARGLARHREIAVRLALGGGRLGVARQLLTESLLLALSGAALGVGGTFWIARALPSIVPRDVLAIERIPVDLTVLGFALAASISTGLLFGIAPVLQIRRVALSSVLQQGARTFTGGGHPRLRRLLVAGQVALTLMLVLGAGLLTRGLVALATVDPGYRTQGLLAVDLALPGSRYQGAIRQRQFYLDLMERTAALPGVASVSATNMVPLGGAYSGIGVDVEGAPAPPAGQELTARYRIVSAGYFKTMDIPVVEGRAFAASDARVAVPLLRWFPQQPQPAGFDAPQPAPVAVVNETMARQFWPNASPIGRRFKVVFSPWITVVGVVADTRNESLRDAVRPEIYLHDLQEPQAAMSLLVRTSADPAPLGPSIRQAIWSIDRNLAITAMRPMEAIVGNTFGLPRLTSWVVGTFAVLALGLMAAGIYGLVAFATVQRMPELGVRIALGADRASVLRMMVRQGLAPALVGVLAGLAGAAGLVRIVDDRIFGVPSVDPLTWIAATLLLTLATLAASVWPAYRASRVDPVSVLRAQ
jgi:putative ABC transport system permease protein